MKYSFVCKKCNFHSLNLTKEQRNEIAKRHKIPRGDGTWACADMKQHTKTKVIRRDQIISAFD